MARLSKTVANEKKKKLIAKHAAKRAELKKVLNDPNADEGEKVDAMFALQRLPRNSSSVRYRNRCVITGRPRGYLRAFGLCRIKFRELSHQGMIPGVTKSSW